MPIVATKDSVPPHGPQDVVDYIGDMSLSLADLAARSGCAELSEALRSAEAIARRTRRSKGRRT